MNDPRVNPNSSWYGYDFYSMKLRDPSYYQGKYDRTGPTKNITGNYFGDAGYKLLGGETVSSAMNGDRTAQFRVLSNGILALDGVASMGVVTRRASTSATAKTVNRGTNRYMEMSLYDETGYVLSEAAQKRYLANGGDIEDALAYSQKIHEKWIDEFGSLDAYVQAHAKYGSELSDMYGMPRTMISTSDELARAKYFGGENGMLFEGPLPKNAYKQTLETSTENEYLIINGTNLLNEVK